MTYVPKGVVGWKGGWHVRLTNHGGRYWGWFVHNPQGGGGGSHDSTKRVALAAALRQVPSGQPYVLEVGNYDQPHKLTQETKP
jgi:hypothetical protein